MTDIAQVAEGLTKAQMDVVSHPENENDVWPNDGRVEKALIRKGLIEPPKFRSLCEWTELGKAVRAHLQGKENG